MKKYLGLVLCVALSARIGWSYIPPAEFIMQSMAKKHKGYKLIQMHTLVSNVEGNGQPGPAHFKETSVFYPATGVLKSWALDDKGEVLFELVAQGKSLSSPAALLLEANPAVIAQALRARGIPILSWAELNTARADAKAALQAQEGTGKQPRSQARASEKQAAEKDGDIPPPPTAPPTGIEKNMLTRWNKTIVWILGVDSPKGKGASPQLWVEKDSFLPLRLFASLEPDKGGELDDLEFQNYRYNREFPYPRTILLSRASSRQSVLRADLTEIQIDSGQDPGRAQMTTGFTDAGNAAPSALRDLIQSYYTVVR